MELICVGVLFSITSFHGKNAFGRLHENRVGSAERQNRSVQI